MNRTYCDVCGAEFLGRDTKSFKVQVQPGYPGRTAGEIEFEIAVERVIRPISPSSTGVVFAISSPYSSSPTTEIRRVPVHICFQCLLDALNLDDERQKKQAVASADLSKFQSTLVDKKKAKK